MAIKFSRGPDARNERRHRATRVAMAMAVPVIMPVLTVIITRRTVIVVVTGQILDAKGDGDSQQEDSRQFAPVVIVITCIRIVFGSAVVMRMKQPDQQKHEHQTRQCPHPGAGRRPECIGRVRQQMQHRDSEHQSTHAAHQQSGPQVRHPQQRRQLSPGNRDNHDHTTIDQWHQRPASPTVKVD